MRPGELLRKYREAKGLSQPQLAALASTSNQQISRLESGQRRLTEKWRAILAPILGVQPEDLAPDAPYRSAAKRAAIRVIDEMSDEQVQVLLPFLQREVLPPERAAHQPKKARHSA